jgi:hypothetical protein
MLAKTLEQHVREAVNRGAFSATPFPHLVVTNLFPESFYNQVTAAWPAFDEMWKPNPTIGRLDFTDPHFNGWVGIETTSLSASQLATWAKFRELVGDILFEEAFQYFKPHMLALGRELLDPPTNNVASNVRRLFRRPDLSFWENVSASDFVPRDQFLTTRQDLSVLAPHIDPAHFHFTQIVYFADDAEHSHLGTTLFRQIGRGRARLPAEIEGYTQYAGQHRIKCEPAGSVPFLPNMMLLFLNGLHSWHGQHLDEPMERRTYNSFFMVRPDRLSAALRPQDIEALRSRKAI